MESVSSNRRITSTHNQTGKITISKINEILSLDHPPIDFLKGADLSFMDLTGFDLSNLDLTGANLSGTNLTDTALMNVKLQDAIISSETVFEKSYITNACFDHCNLSGVNFKAATILETSFCNATLTEAKFNGATICQSLFSNSDLILSDFTEASLHSCSFTFAKLNSAKFTNVLKNQSNLDFEGADKTDLDPNSFLLEKNKNELIRFQANFRSFIAMKGQLLPGGELPVRKYATDGAPAAVLLSDVWHKFPKELNVSGESGKDKTHTHGRRDDSLVGLTLKDPETYKPTQKEFVDLCSTHNLKMIVNQRLVNKSTVVASNLGVMEPEKIALLKDLKLKDPSNMTPEELILWESKDKTPLNFKQLILNGEYTFDIDHFRPLAENIDIVHENGFGHRDIKSANAVFNNKYVYVIDNDTGGKIGKFPTGSSVLTDLYTHMLLRPKMNEDDNTEGKVVVRDNYGFFIMMMQAFHKKLPMDGRYSPQEIQQFVDNALNCSNELKDSLKSFMNNPRDRPLINKSISAYLTP